MKFNVITLMPDMISQALEFGVVGSAFKKKICSLNLVNPRVFTEDNHKTVDDRPFGGGDGMLMMAEPLQQALESLKTEGPVYYLSPQGKVFDDSMAKEMSQLSELTLICGRYGGVDERFLQKNQIQEVSIGDYVLSGGELGSLVMMDAIVRQIPGVLGHVSSALEDSFHNGLLEAPHYTRPQNWRGLEVPEVLLSGDHKKIAEYRKQMSLEVTQKKRPDLLKNKENKDG